MAMTIKFKAASGKNAGENWPICWTGQDELGKHWSVTTNQIHGSELSTVSQGAAGDAELIARLLNWYYCDPLAIARVAINTNG